MRSNDCLGVCLIERTTILRVLHFQLANISGPSALAWAASVKCMLIRGHGVRHPHSDGADLSIDHGAVFLQLLPVLCAFATLGTGILEVARPCENLTQGQTFHSVRLLTGRRQAPHKRKALYRDIRRSCFASMAHSE